MNRRLLSLSFMAYAKDSIQGQDASASLRLFSQFGGFFASLIIGALAGWIAGRITKSPHGLLMNIILGLVGGLIGGWLVGLLGLGGSLLYSGLGGLIRAVIGACLLVWLARLISGKKK